MKRLYEVQLQEVHYSTWQVEAESQQDAVDRVRDGDGEEVSMEYSHTLEEGDGAAKVKEL